MHARLPDGLFVFWPLILLASGSASAGEAILEKAAKAFLNSAALVRNYDVYIKVHTTFQMKSLPQGPKGQPTGFVWVPWNRDEIPLVLDYQARQVMSNDRKRRAEVIDSRSGEVINILVSTGEIGASFAPLQKSALISKPLVEIAGYGMDYSALYCSAYGQILFSAIFVDRNNLRLVDQNSDGCVVVETAPNAGTIMTPLGWKLWLDPNNGFLPKRIETYRFSMDRLEARMDITDTIELPEGVRVPVNATLVHIDSDPKAKTYGKILSTDVITVDTSKSRWNVTLPENTFTIDFPPGTEVFNRIHDTTMVVAAGTSKGLEAVIEQAKALQRTPVLKSGFPWRLVAISANIVVIVVLVAWIVYFRRREKFA